MNARGVGETMVSVGGGGASVDTSSSANAKRWLVQLLLNVFLHIPLIVVAE